jgi:hypothetical protein
MEQAVQFQSALGAGEETRDLVHSCNQLDAHVAQVTTERWLSVLGLCTYGGQGVHLRQHTPTPALAASVC